MNNIDQLKQIIRKEQLIQRESTEQHDQFKANKLIGQNLMKILAQNANHNIFGLYLPMQGEADIVRMGLKKDKTIALPKIANQQIIFVKYQPGEPLEQSKFTKLMQPKSKQEIIPQVIIVPGLCFSIKGDRLGFGLGHYDKYLYKIKQFCQPIVIGVCFHNNLKLSLPNDQNDQKMNFIITDQIILKI